MALSKRRRNYWSESDFTTQLFRIGITVSQLFHIVGILQRTADNISEQHFQGLMHDKRKFWYIIPRALSLIHI